MCVTVSFVFGKNPACDTDRTQTCNLLIRSQMLYSIKLRCLLLHHKSSAFSDNSKIYIPIFVKIYHPSHL